MRWLICAMLLALMGCGKAANNGPTATADIREGSAPALAQTKPAAPGAATPAFVAPRIAYSYAYRFEVPAKRMAEVAHAHQALCDALGPAKCQTIGATLEGRAGAYSCGTLTLRLAPEVARTFGAPLGKAVADADGSLIQSGVTGEDLTRQVIDADAALKAKRTLRDRLQALLENRQGRLADLLEVEKALAETQQELDTATALLAELHTRLDFSKVEIAYESSLPPPGEDRRPIAGALGSVGDVLGTSIAFLITAMSALLPFAILVGLAVLGWRTWRRRNPRRPE